MHVAEVKRLVRERVFRKRLGGMGHVPVSSQAAEKRPRRPTRVSQQPARFVMGLSSLALLMSMALLPGVPSLAGAPPDCGRALQAAAAGSQHRGHPHGRPGPPARIPQLHIQPEISRRHAGLFPTVQAPRLPSFNESDVLDKPAYIQSMSLLTDKQIAQVDEIYRQRIRSLQSVDEAIAALVSTLQSVGQLDNTYIFFTSDNAFHLGEKRMTAGKYTPYETDIRVPFIARGPGVPKGGTITHMTTEVDFAATWVEIAGASLSVATDGRSLVPLLGANPPASSTWRRSGPPGAVRLGQPPGRIQARAPLEPGDLRRPPGTPRPAGHRGGRQAVARALRLHDG